MSVHYIDYEMRCRHCGEGKQLPQRSILESRVDFVTDGKINSEYRQAELLAEILEDCDVECDVCGISMWDIYKIQVDEKALFELKDNKLHYIVKIDKSELGEISYEVSSDEGLTLGLKDSAVIMLSNALDSMPEGRFSDNKLTFGGEAEMIISFKFFSSIIGWIEDRIEILSFSGLRKVELLSILSEIHYRYNRLV